MKNNYQNEPDKKTGLENKSKMQPEKAIIPVVPIITDQQPVHLQQARQNKIRHNAKLKILFLVTMRAYTDRATVSRH